MEYNILNKLCMYIELDAENKVVFASPLFEEFIANGKLEETCILDVSSDYQESNLSNDFELNIIYKELNSSNKDSLIFNWLWKTPKSQSSFTKVKITKCEQGHFFWIIEDVSDIKDDFNSLYKDYFTIDESLKFFSQMFYITDSNNLLIKANIFFYKFFKLDPKTSVGKRLENIVKKESNDLIKTSSYTISEDLYTRNKNHYWFKSFRYKVLNQDGLPYASCVISIDITNEKKLQNELEETRAQSFAKSKLATLGEIAGGIAHEINNPLAIISTNVSLLEKYIIKGKTEGPKIFDIISNVKDIVTRISKITKALRKVSRDGSSDNFEEITFQDVMDDTLNLCKQKLIKEKIELLIDIENTKNIKIKGQIVQLSQVFLNLFMNSIDSLKADDKISIKTQLTKNKMIITFEDSGEGVPKEIQSKVFQPFFTTKEIGKGTGLGLSISKSIIEDHGGEFFLATEESNSTFKIILPLSR